MTTIGDLIKSAKSLIDLIMAIFKTFLKLSGNEEEEKKEEKEEEEEAE